jgi:hypothetical protein
MPARFPVRRRSSPIALVLVAVWVAACGGSGGRDVATPIEITSAQEAAAYVAARSPLFEGIEPYQDDMIGQARWWRAEPVDAGWRVVFRIGWGDCMAGCIAARQWSLDVSRAGTLTVVEESGEPLPPEVIAELRAAGPSRTGLAGRAVAGPTCPVEQPGDPACAPRPVAGTELVIRSAADGAEAARAITDGAGFFRLDLAPGTYILEASPAEGLMGMPEPIPFTVSTGSEVLLDLGYDTGIR